MKKRIITLIILIMSVLIGCSSVMGCNLVTVDKDRDIEQVVATVSIEEGFKDEIKKKELLLYYMNYGHSYEEQGYTQEQILEALVDQMVNSKILLQHAMVEFNSQVAPYDTVEIDTTKAVTDPTRYLTEEEVEDAIYTTRHSLEELLESYEEKEEDKADALVDEVRTAPTNATNAEEEMSLQEKKDHNAKKFENEFSRKAFLEVVRLLDTNSLKGKNYDGTIESTEYYQQLLKSAFEGLVVEKFSDIVTIEALRKFDFSDLESAYLDKYEEQKEWNNKEFAEAIGNASLNSPVLYSAFGSYGYVYNILLGVNDDQKTKIEDIDATLSDAEKELKRKEILKDTVVKDLRSSWILSGYDFDGTKFTGDYTLVKDPANSLEFKGSTTLIKEAEHHNPAVYRIDSVNTYSLDSFISMMENYLYGKQMTSADVSALSYKESVYKMVVANDDIVDYDGKINELLFAFSTDAGSLNTYKGYAIKPPVDGKDTEEFVTTFAQAGRTLLEKGATNKSSYVIVASNYGYHVMFFSQVFTPDYSAGTTLVDYLNHLNGENQDRTYWNSKFVEMIEGWKDWEDDKNYMFLLANDIVSTSVSQELNKVQTDIVNTYRYEQQGKITINPDTYADLIV